MNNMRRKIGLNIYILMNELNISHEEMAKELGYTLRDMYRLTEGCLILPPIELEKISNKLNISKHELLNHEPNTSIPELQYIKKFNNLDKILDLIDEYIELKESL